MLVQSTNIFFENVKRSGFVILLTPPETNLQQTSNKPSNISDWQIFDLSVRRFVRGLLKICQLDKESKNVNKERKKQVTRRIKRFCQPNQRLDKPA